jgi:hypothetical protein
MRDGHAIHTRVQVIDGERYKAEIVERARERGRTIYMPEAARDSAPVAHCCWIHLVPDDAWVKELEQQLNSRLKMKGGSTTWDV